MLKPAKKTNKRYYLLYIGFVSGGKYYKFAESNKHKALSLQKKYKLMNIFTELKVIEPKPSNYTQLSIFDNWIKV